MKKLKTVLIHRQHNVYVPHPKKSTKALLELITALN